uniref:Uncharacterized protein n=2 Tax=Caenorhabditis japonica TaxID=281687 RepID=A0A8R1E302_CAEJA
MRESRIQAIKGHGHLHIDVKKLNTCEGKQVDMIIGTNVLWQLLRKAQIRTINNTKSIVCTEIGSFIIPTMTGDNIEPAEESAEVFNSEDWVTQMCGADNNADDELAAATEKLWNLNALGMQNPDMATEEMSQVEEAMAEFKRTAEWENGKLLVKLPMNGNKVHLDDNLPVAMKRLVNQVYKLAPNEEALNEYNDILQKQEESGFIEQCSQEPAKGRCFYIPQKAVFKTESNTTN